MDYNVRRRTKKIVNYLDSNLLKITISLGLTKTIETIIAITAPQIWQQTIAWLTFLTIITLLYTFQDPIEDKAEHVKEKVEN